MLLRIYIDCMTNPFCDRRAEPMVFFQPINLGERRKVALQREMLRAAGSPKTGADYPPKNMIKSMGEWPKVGWQVVMRVASESTV